MPVFPDILKSKRILTLMLVLGFSSCAYYNTFYNAEEYFAEAQKLTRENQTETVSRDEINLYSKAIEKSKKLLQKYPESKYRDDAQFVIAKAYFFKGDYLLSKRYFEDLSRNYANSPHAKEVPLWIGRCLVKTGDLEMARYEASRILRGGANRGLQADALLLMGEIAVKQDSLGAAEKYLEQVIDKSPDGFTKAQAQFQVGQMRENKLDHEGALRAYKSVARYKPSESLKVEAIIRQTSMLKALNRDEDAVEMIQEMLLSDKFVEIRGQLEVELGKLYLVMDKDDRAESKLTTIVEDYNRQDVAAEASFYLGELYLTKTLNYGAAREAYTNVKTQSTRSPFVTKASMRLKQIDRYEKIQLDHINLNRQLAGLPPVVKEKKQNSNVRSRGEGNTRGRSRGNKLGNSAKEDASQRRPEPKKKEEVEAIEVSPEDSVRLHKGIGENRYSLAEYMLFEFTRVDTTLEILQHIEMTSPDSSLTHQAAYMQYYALESIKGDAKRGREALVHIQKTYPHYYATVMNDSTKKVEVVDTAKSQFLEISSLFDSGDYSGASAAYFEMKEDTTISIGIRGKSCFNHAWLNDHFLYDKTTAVDAYTYMIANFPDEPLTQTARKRLNALTAQVSDVPESEAEVSQQEIEDEEQPSESKSNRPKEPKEGEKEK